MSEFQKFTPRPWKLVTSTHGTVKPRLLVVPGNSELIAQVICDCGTIDEADAHANGHLIAAAPELYEALEKADAALLAVGMLITKLPYSVFKRISAEVNQAMDAQEIVEAALAKARGEA